MLLTPDRASASAGPFASVHAHINRTLAWAIPVATVVLLLPVLLMQPESKNTLSPDAWLEFASPQSSQIHFEDATPLEIHFGLVRPLQDDDWTEETASQDDKPAYHAPRVSIYTILRWYDPSSTPPRRLPPLAGSLQYKIDPSFGFDNRELQLDGMMIRVWFDF